jgi:hypothetical protein
MSFPDVDLTTDYYVSDTSIVVRSIRAVSERGLRDRGFARFRFRAQPRDHNHTVVDDAEADQQVAMISKVS